MGQIGGIRMCIHLKFDYKKATQVLNFFALKQGGEINKLKALKLVFFADRYHLRKFGRPITNDEYYAMKLGPVASGVKDIAENSSFLDEKEGIYREEFLKSDRYDFCSLRDIDTNVFSESDLEALEFSWNKFGQFDEFRLSDLTHFYPEWQKHEKSLEHSSRIKMFFEDFLEDPMEGFEECFSLTDEQRKDRLNYLSEMSRIEALWT